jgi:acylphosphatase
MHRVHVVIRGRVQGVGFRYFVLRRARALGLTGWVRNRADGGVELEAEGDRVALEQLLETLRQGPPAARVGAVEVDWSEGPRHREGFEIEG